MGGLGRRREKAVERGSKGPDMDKRVGQRGGTEGVKRAGYGQKKKKGNEMGKIGQDCGSGRIGYEPNLSPLLARHAREGLTGKGLRGA